MRSGLCAARPRRAQSGYVVASSRRPAPSPTSTSGAPADRRPAGLALEHERLWNLDTARRRRLDAIDALLPMMANVLDMREIFNQVSAVVKPVLPHDLLVLSSLSADRSVMTVDALSGEPAPELWRPMPVRELDLRACRRARAGRRHGGGAGTESERCRKCRMLGVRSLLKIPLRLDGGYIGSLIFLSQDSGPVLRGGRRRGPPGRRPREPRPLAPAPGRGGAAGRGGARARRAARGARAGAHATSSRRTRGYRRVVGESKKWKDVLDPGREGGADRDHGPAHRRVGHRQGGRRPLHPPRARRARGGPFVGAQLRRAAGDAARIGAVRPREGRVHRRDRGARRAASSRRPAACSSSTRSAR